MTPLPASPLPQPLRDVPFTVAEGAAKGLSRARMRGSDVESPFHGVRRRVDGADDSVERRCRAYAARMLPGQAFSHTTAALLWGMPLPSASARAPELHVSEIAHGSLPRTRGVAGHAIRPNGVSRVLRMGLPVLDAATVWLQLCAMLQLDDLVAAGDHLVLTPRRIRAGERRPHVDRLALAERVARYHGRGAKSAATAMALVRDGSESPRETLLRLRLIRHGLPEPGLNREVLGLQGERIGFGDLVYPPWKVLVEYEGEQHRTDSRQFYRDVRRHEALHTAGWILVRETKETPAHGPDSAAVRAEAALRSRGWSPPASPR